MGKVLAFEDLKVWQKSRMLCRKIFLIIRQEPFSKDFQLRDQINGSSGSIMDNIAEGFGRNGNKEFIQFINIANGSLMETKSQLYRAFDRGYITCETFSELQQLCNEISKMLYSFMKYLKSSSMKGQKNKLSETVPH